LESIKQCHHDVAHKNNNEEAEEVHHQYHQTTPPSVVEKETSFPPSSPCVTKVHLYKIGIKFNGKCFGEHSNAKQSISVLLTRQGPLSVNNPITYSDIITMFKNLFAAQLEERFDEDEYEIYC